MGRKSVRVAMGVLAGFSAVLGLSGCTNEVAFEDGAVTSEQAPIIGGDAVTSPSGWEKRVVNIGNFCSGVLLTNQWLLTASHCLGPDLSLGQKRPLPVRPASYVNDVMTSHLFWHPTLDIAVAHLLTPISTGYSGTLALYSGSASALPGKTITAYGFGWEAVDWATGRNGCNADSDCPAGYQCSYFGDSFETGDHWCRKKSHTLHRASFPIDSLADSTRYILLRTKDKKITGPADSGGPSFLPDGTITGVHSRLNVYFSDAKDAIVPADWITNRVQNCQLFDINHLGDICTPDCPCDVGEGDCDHDADCRDGLVCRQYGTGRRPHGFPELFDICVDPACPATFDPANPFNGRCWLSAGEGGCDSDNDCGGTLVCKPAIGKTVSTAASPDLGLCVNQPAPGCLEDGCTPSCPCDLGERCGSNADCRPGLMCAIGRAPELGRTDATSICVEPAALTCTTDVQCPGGVCWQGGCRLIPPVAVNSPSACGYLSANEGMYPNHPHYSCDGNLRLYLQSDGNLVLSKRDTQGNYSILIWNTGSRTIGKDGYTLIMQVDGNLVLYDSVRVPIWSSGTNGHPDEGLYTKLTSTGLQVRTGSTVFWRSSDNP